MKSRRKDDQGKALTNRNTTVLDSKELNITVEPLQGEFWPYTSEEEQAAASLTPDVVHSCMPELSDETSCVEDVVEYVTLDNIGQNVNLEFVVGQNVQPDIGLPYEPNISEIRSKLNLWSHAC